MSTASATPQLIARHSRYELLSTLRNGEQLLLTFILPALALIFLIRTEIFEISTTIGSRVQIVTAGVFALAVISSSLTSVAIATGFERRSGALRMFATTPLGRKGLLGGKVGSVFALQIVQLLILGTIAAILGWRPAISGIPLVFLACLLGTFAFTSLALLIAGTLRAEAVLAGANLLWVLFIAAGGLLLPGAAWTTWLPSGALGDVMRAGVIGSPIPWVSIAVLIFWGGAFTAAALKFFRWH